MTGGQAQISTEVGGRFSAWDGYITGTNLDLDHGSRILQSWRTTDFSPDESDSILEIEFTQEELNTRLTIRHTQLPSHGKQYKQGWFDAYLEPMKRFFSSLDSQ
jgi:activator of HSP90 ATPase